MNACVCVKNSRAKRTRIQQTSGKQAVCNLQFFICFPHNNSLPLHSHTKKEKNWAGLKYSSATNADIIQQRNSTFFHHHNLNPKEIKKLCKLDRKYVFMCLGNSRIIKPWNFALQRDGKCAWNSRIKKPWNFYNNFVWNNLRKSLEIEESVRKVPPSLSPSLTARMEEITNGTHPPN
jgi:hypothetical protein